MSLDLIPEKSVVSAAQSCPFCSVSTGRPSGLGSAQWPLTRSPVGSFLDVSSVGAWLGAPGWGVDLSGKRGTAPGGSRGLGPHPASLILVCPGQRACVEPVQEVWTEPPSG